MVTTVSRQEITGGDASVAQRALAATVAVAAGAALVSKRRGRRARADRRLRRDRRPRARRRDPRPVTGAAAERGRHGDHGPDPAGGGAARRRGRRSRPPRASPRCGRWRAAPPSGGRSREPAVRLRLQRALRPSARARAAAALRERLRGRRADARPHPFRPVRAAPSRARVAPARGTGRTRSFLRGGDRRTVHPGPAPQALPDAGQRTGARSASTCCAPRSTSPFELDAPVVSMWSGSVAPDEDRERAWDLLVDGCARVIEHAEDSGVTLAFEPEPGMLVERLADYEELRERLGHPPALGLTLDIGHIVCLEPMSVTECVRRGAPTLAHVHIEDMRRGVHEHLMFGEGELDLDEALRVLDGDRIRRLGRRGAVPPFARRARDGAGGEGGTARGRTGGGGLTCKELDRRARGSGAARGTGLAAGGECRRGRRRDRDPLAVPDGRAQGRARAAGRGRGPVRRPRVDDRRRGARAAAARRRARRSRASSPSSTATATRPSAAACCARCRSSSSATAALSLVDDAIRTNDTRLIAAALGPYATEHLPDASYDQAVLKCVFVGVPITGLDGIPARVTPDGARMLGAFVHERVAAGRDVPARGLDGRRSLPARGGDRRDRERVAERVRGPPRGGRARSQLPRIAGASMRIFDPHAHMTSRTTDDYEAMYASGVRALVEPAFWLGQPRTSVGSFVDYFNSLLGWERFRAGQFGIRHHCTIGLNPKEANDDLLRREVIDILPRFLAKDGVVAVGEIGFDAMTAAEEEALLRAARARDRARAAGARAHAAPRQGRGHAEDDRARREVRPGAEHDADRPQQRAHRARRAGVRLLGRASRSTRARRWTSSAWCACSRTSARSGSSSTRRATGACPTR